jgi:serine/threonine protein kinase
MCPDSFDPLAPHPVRIDDDVHSCRKCVKAPSADDDFDDQVFEGVDGGDEVTSGRCLLRMTQQTAPGIASDVSVDSCYGGSVSSRTESESNSRELHTVRVRVTSRRQQSMDSALRPTGVASLPEGESCRFRLKRLLGAGAFGRVYLCCRCAAVSPDDVAVKILRGRSVVDSLRSETNALNFDHENVTSFLAAGWVITRPGTDDVTGEGDDVSCESRRRRASSRTPKVAAVLMEFVDGRNLQTIIDDKSETIDFGRRARYVKEMNG